MMKTEVKTLEGWKGYWSDYASSGDLVDEEIHDYFLNVVPPRSKKTNYLQAGDPYIHRMNRKTGKWQGTYPTFVRVGKGTWLYCGNCFPEENYDAGEMENVKSLQDFMKATYRVIGGIQNVRPKIICRDGFTISVQAGSIYHCEPETNLENGAYTSYEVGHPSMREELLEPYAEDKEDIHCQVYEKVPAAVVEQILLKHGGILF